MGLDMSGAPNVSPVAFPGDPGHEAGNKHMQGLKGGCTVANVYPSQGPAANTGSAVGSPSDTSGDIMGWDSTALADTGGARGIGGNDNRTKST
jgi:hypothetical protein